MLPKLTKSRLAVMLGRISVLPDLLIFRGFLIFAGFLFFVGFLANLEGFGVGGQLSTSWDLRGINDTHSCSNIGSFAQINCTLAYSHHISVMCSRVQSGAGLLSCSLLRHLLSWRIGGEKWCRKAELIDSWENWGVSRELFFLDQQEIILNRNKLVDPARFGKEESV